MRKLLIILLPVFFIGCATTNKMSVSYDRTNPVKIEESISGLPVEIFVGENINPSKDLIVLSSTETLLADQKDYHLDTGTRYLIEDNLISSLKSSGYRVGERDPEIMWHLSRESKDKYNLYNFQYKANEAEKEEEAKAPEGATINNYYYGDVDNSANMSKSEAKTKEEESEETVFTDLTAADILLTYRVLECGVIYKDIENDMNNVERLARTRLNCRLTNAKTGEILNAGIVENEVTDVISKQDKEGLKEIHYKFYEHTLPNIYGEESINEQTELLPSASSATAKGKPVLIKLIGGFLLGMILIN